MRVPDCLTKSGPLNETDLGELEVLAFEGDDLVHRSLQHLLREVRRLRHELADPAFMYAGGRIRRDAILCRNAENDQLQEQIKKLTSKESQ
jgi:hypothetical protein